MALALGLCLAVLGGTGCNVVSGRWHWTLGKTHGVIIETTAGRASLAVYRVPSDALYKVMQATNIQTVEDLLWNYGRPPEIKRTFSFDGRSITVSFGVGTTALRLFAHQVIYDRDSDLEGAMRDSHREHNCLAVTLISYGIPEVNWTRKSVGCNDGGV